MSIKSTIELLPEECNMPSLQLKINTCTGYFWDANTYKRCYYYDYAWMMTKSGIDIMKYQLIFGLLCEDIESKARL